MRGDRLRIQTLGGLQVCCLLVTTTRGELGSASNKSTVPNAMVLLMRSCEKMHWSGAAKLHRSPLIYRIVCTYACHSGSLHIRSQLMYPVQARVAIQAPVLTDTKGYASILLVSLASSNEALAPLLSLPPHLPGPLRQSESPVPRDHHATQHVHDLEPELQEPGAGLLDGQQDGLDVVLDKNAGDAHITDHVALLGDGELVGVDGAGAEALATDRVDRGHYREEVLELVKVVRGDVDGAVEGVLERGVEGTERELVDDVRKVEL